MPANFYTLTSDIGESVTEVTLAFQHSGGPNTPTVEADIVALVKGFLRSLNPESPQVTATKTETVVTVLDV